MGFPSRYCRFAVLSFFIVFCFPLVRAQNNPQAPQVPGRNNAAPIQGFRRAQMEGPQSEIPARELLRLLDTPAAQRALGLADEQRKKIEDITFNLQRTMVQQEAALRVQQLDLERLMRADSPDRGAIDKKIQEISQAQAAVMRTSINGVLDMRNVLTKEQQEKLKEFVRQRAQQRIQPGAPPRPPAPPAPPAQPRPPAD
jgi:Spy/CpxP family protein refolding chaperone